MSREQIYADEDEVWSIYVTPEGQKTKSQSTSFTKLEMFKAKFPDIWEAIVGRDELGGVHKDGLRDKVRKWHESQGTEGEEKPSADVGEWTVTINKYYPDSGMFYIGRRPKGSGGKGWGGGKPTPLLTLTEVFYSDDLKILNDRLSTAKEGEIYRAGNPLFAPDGKIVVLKLKAVA